MNPTDAMSNTVERIGKRIAELEKTLTAETRTIGLQKKELADLTKRLAWAKTIIDAFACEFVWDD